MTATLKRPRSWGAIAALSMLFVGGVASSAPALTGNGPFAVSNSYVSISGTMTWYTNGVNHGGMGVAGYLRDKSVDSHSVKVNGKVSGYSYPGPPLQQLGH